MAQPSYPSEAPPISVVGRQFCAPNTVVLTLILNSSSIAVTNAEGDDVFRGNWVSFSLRERRVLQDTAGNTLITMQKKLRTVHSRWKVFRGASRDNVDLLFTVKKSRMLQTKTSLDVFLASNTEGRVCDFMVRESNSGGSLNVYRGDSSVKLAEMMQGSDRFVVTICPNVDQAFVVTLITSLVEINHNSGEGLAIFIDLLTSF